MKNDILEDTTFTIKTSFTYLNVCLLFSRIQQQFSVGIKNQPESYASTFLSEFQTVICTLWFLSLTYIVHNLFFYYGSHTTRELFQRSTLKPIQINNPYEVSPLPPIHHNPFSPLYQKFPTRIHYTIHFFLFPPVPINSKHSPYYTANTYFIYPVIMNCLNLSQIT